jgi:hypothetical protein
MARGAAKAGNMAGTIPSIYTQIGMDWVQQTSMIDVMLRHYPRLRPALRGVAIAFQPWQRVSGSVSSR